MNANDRKENFMFVEVRNVCKSYGENEAAAQVLKNVNFEIEKGKICVVLGPSGSGKSTLMNLMGGLDEISSGDIIVGGVSLAKKTAKELAEYRRQKLGFVFQFYNLIPDLTIRDNILSCAYLSSSPLDADELIDVLGLKEHGKKYPSQVSGGQQQRCAIARALIKNPELLLCDEPTGALDTKTTKIILSLLEKVNKKYGTTMLIITHNNVIKEMADQVITIKDGSIDKIEYNDNPASAENLEF